MVKAKRLSSLKRISLASGKKIGEFNSSSSSGVHYGHFKAAIQDQISTSVLALQLTIIACNGVPPENWSVEL
jgi:hypothetical protein